MTFWNSAVNGIEFRNNNSELGGKFYILYNIITRVYVSLSKDIICVPTTTAAIIQNELYFWLKVIS